jgi:hypothetical protein
MRLGSALYFGPAIALRLLKESITTQSATRWINKFSNISHSNRLYSYASQELSLLNFRYVEFLNKIKHPNIEEAQLKAEALSHVLSPLQSLYIVKKLYEEVGIHSAINDMLDSLWEFSKDIENSIFTERQFYKWNLNYHVDDWRTLIEIYEKNPNQTAYNYFFGKLIEIRHH